MKMYKERLLSDIQLKRLREHKYSCTSNSLCDAFLQPWWNWLVAQVPLWVAPNLITILGLTVNIITTLILVCYSPDAKAEAPRWACFLCGFGLFVYQSLDAIDGKQARRTGNSNPLGELFDHGCDSISTIFVAISACIAVQLGHHPVWMFFQCFCAMTLFYCAHWQTYVSGTLRFGKIDVTEAQYTIIGIQMVSTLFGTNVWSIKVVEFDIWPVGVLTWSRVICFVFYGGFAQLFLNFIHAIKKGGCGKNGSTIAGTSVLSPIIPFCTVLVPAFIIYVKSQHEVYEKHPILYILAFGLVAAKITNKLVVAHMTKSEMEYVDISLLGPAMLFFNQYFNFFIPEHYVLWACMIFVTVDFYIYCNKICMEICDHLHVQLFRIPYLNSGSMHVHTSIANHHGRHNYNILTNQLKSTINSEKNGTNINRVATRSRKR